MTALEKMGEPPLTPDSLVPIMLKSAEGWDQVAAFVALTMRRKMEIAWERQGRLIAAATQHLMPDLAIPLFLSSATQQRKQKTIQAGLLRRHLAANLPPRPEILIGPKTKGECSHTIRILEQQRRNEGRKVACAKVFPPLSQHRPFVTIPGKGVRCQWGQFGMRASPYAPPNIEYEFYYPLVKVHLGYFYTLLFHSLFKVEFDIDHFVLGEHWERQ